MKYQQQLPAPDVPKRKSFLRHLGMVLAGLVAIIYLLNPDAGIIELIPDNIPVIGNLDELGAAILLIKVFAYFGWDPFNLWKNRK